mgnify:FL=1
MITLLIYLFKIQNLLKNNEHLTGIVYLNANILEKKLNKNIK